MGRKFRMILIIKHEEIEGPGTLGYFFTATHWDVKTVELWRGDSLPSLDECEAVISLGGPMNVYEEEDHPFLGLEDEFLRGAIERDIPTLGICLGAQLLAKSMNAEVKKAEKQELGWYKIRLSAEAQTRDILFKGLPEILDVFQWHEDTFEIPKDTQLLATSETCKNQAMRIGETAWGLQFHPEITLQMIEDWVDFYGGNVDKDGLINGYLRRKNSYYKQAQIFYQNFARVIELQKTKAIHN